MAFPKLGILGAGQLGKMLCQAASPWELPIYALDQAATFPAAAYCKSFKEGSFKNYDDVLAFGRDMDIITIEIEHVNTAALKQLQKENKIVHPNPSALEIIKDKGLQKQFYQKHQIPTAPFRLYKDKTALLQAVKSGERSYPFVQKSRTAGYDGNGVAVIKNEADLAEKLLDAASMVEDKVDIAKEIAVIAARNEQGEVVVFDPVEMEFNPIANLVEFLICPSNLTAAQIERCSSLAKEIIQAYDICGLLAVEFFLDKEGQILVNEVAPRPHNSGHHTIDAAVTSQYEQHLRGVLNLPLGNTQILKPAVMVNLLGAAGYTGKAVYEGLAECLAIEGVKIHIYGKEITKPFRKMGHATIIADTIEEAKEKARKVQSLLTIKSQD
jgi:5-(carboxyamino)imidazole ribonucleotide synthase